MVAPLKAATLSGQLKPELMFWRLHLYLCCLYWSCLSYTIMNRREKITLKWSLVSVVTQCSNLYFGDKMKWYLFRDFCVKEREHLLINRSGSHYPVVNGLSIDREQLAKSWVQIAKLQIAAYYLSFNVQFPVLSVSAQLIVTVCVDCPPTWLWLEGPRRTWSRVKLLRGEWVPLSSRFLFSPILDQRAISMLV